MAPIGPSHQPVNSYFPAQARAMDLEDIRNYRRWHREAALLDRDGWTPVSRRVLEQALGCGTSGLRAALDRLVAADIIARREQPGGVSAFRFTDAAQAPQGVPQP